MKRVELKLKRVVRGMYIFLNWYERQRIIIKILLITVSLYVVYIVILYLLCYIDTLLLLTIKRKSKLKKTQLLSVILSPCLFPYPPPPP